MRIAVATALAAATAVVANLLVRALGVALFDIPSGFEEIAPRAVILSTIGGVIAAGLAFALVARLARDPVRTYLVVVVVALLLSLWPPLQLDAEAGARATLAAMHVVTAAICAVVLTRGVPASRSP